MKYQVTLNGGPLDGAVVDIEPEDPDGVDPFLAKQRGPLTFGGLVYDLDLAAGTCHFVSGRDETHILDEIERLK